MVRTRSARIEETFHCVEENSGLRMISGALKRHFSSVCTSLTTLCQKRLDRIRNKLIRL